MKKPKKHLKTIARLRSYLKKESVKLEKIIARSGEIEDSSLVDGIIRRLADRRTAALSDLGLIDAADEAARKAVKSGRAEKASARKSRKVSAKKAAKKAPKKVAQSSRKIVKTPARKAAAKKTVPARRRAVKANPPAEA